MAKKTEKENPIIGREKQEIDLIKFNVKSPEEQNSEVENVLKEIYQDDLKISKKHISKVIKLTYSAKDNYTFLPYNLKVSKEKLSLKFEVLPKKPVGIGWVIFSIWLFIFAVIAATYAGFNYLRLSDLNKDIDGDGIPDINIDINNDGEADINIDVDGDDIPDLNIDYKGNRKAVFNIDTDGDGIADSNLVNDATDGNPCDINCDINGDGWPDLNIDLDGDGVPDVDMDTNGDGIADLNIDSDGDGICDINCDTNGDGLCDYRCLQAHELDDGLSTGTSVVTGTGKVETATPYLIINYEHGLTVNVQGLLPDDQPPIPGHTNEKPVKEFIVENMSDYPIYYSLRWNVTTNTFITDNLKYTMVGSNGGPSLDKTTMPKRSATIFENILIMPRVTQKFRVEMNLEGTGEPQNEDQGRLFVGHVDVILNPN